jgi:hypothetical protein
MDGGPMTYLVAGSLATATAILLLAFRLLTVGFT